MSSAAQAKLLGSETAWIIIICFFGVLAYALAMCWLLCCSRERRWEPAQHLQNLDGDLMFVLREPADESTAFSTEEEPKLPGTFLLGRQLSNPSLYGRVIVIKGAATFVVWNKADEDEGDDDELEKKQIKTLLHSEAYGTIFPRQVFRLQDIEPGSFLCLEEYRLPTPEEKIEHAQAVAEAMEKDTRTKKKD